jgi:mRNA-degrading endonuclease RelE of RelBE toxin-antitoxin system
VNHVELSGRAQRDLRRMERPERERIAKALDGLAAVPPPDNLDIEPLKGKKPWMRMREGDWRIIYRPMSAAELEHMAELGDLEGYEGFLVARVVNRKDLEKAVKALVRE